MASNVTQLHKPKIPTLDDDDVRSLTLRFALQGIASQFAAIQAAGCSRAAFAPHDKLFHEALGAVMAYSVASSSVLTLPGAVATLRQVAEALVARIALEANGAAAQWAEHQAAAAGPVRS